MDERKRLREVRKYEQLLALRESDGSTLSHTHGLNRDEGSSEWSTTALTAWLELLVHRLDIECAMVSLVDKSDQYFLAESTIAQSRASLSTLNRATASWWIGCGGTPRNQALCAQTIETPADALGHACFEILNLAQDERFAELPFVKGSPHVKYYAGVPLTAKSGARIGSVFVLDTRAHSSLGSDKIAFLCSVSDLVMQYLETQYQMELGKRHMLMSRGLSAFVEHKDRIPTEWQSEKMPLTGTTPRLEKGIDAQPRRPGLSSPIQSDSTGLSQITVLARASSLLRESLDVDYILFCDATKCPVPSLRCEQCDNLGRNLNQTGSNLCGHIRLAELLSFSTREDSTLIGSSYSSSSCAAEPDSQLVQDLDERYSDGRLWSFDEDAELICVDRSPLSLTTADNVVGNGDSNLALVGLSHIGPEADTLVRCFPGVRQMIYVPLSNNRLPHSRVACFAVSLREVPVLTSEIEVAFTRAFVNSVAVECDRIQTAISDMKKTTFISSISHELRTPLHGILGAVDMLTESRLDQSQSMFLDTISSCGRVLLDTMTHVLDYSKINSFRQREEAVLGKANTSLKQSANRDITLHPSLSLESYSQVDVSVICEEAIEAIVASHRRTDGLTSDFKATEQRLKSIESGSVAVVLDFAAGDWQFYCPAGAIRRIILNLVGNSLKYTERGYVKIHLGIEDETIIANPGQSFSVISIRISDTGRGMSEHFLNNRAFTPFCQESSLEPGVGLGLSMTRDITRTLDGDVYIRSSLGTGTIVEVRLPLVRSALATQNKHHQVHYPRDSDRNTIDLDQLKPLVGQTIGFYGFENATDVMLQRSLEGYLTSWFNLRTSLDRRDVDIMIMNGEVSEELFQDAREHAQIVIYHDHEAYMNASAIHQHRKGRSIPIMRPCGPKKLAQALISCHNRSERHIADSVNLATDHAGEQHRIVPILSPSLAHHAKPGSADRLSEGAGSRKQGKDDELHYAECECGVDRLTSKILDRGSPPDLHTEVEPKDDSATSQNRSPRVLCVDDNNINLEILKAYLKKLSLTNVETASNGREAYEIIDKCRLAFDIIFMDISMPICDGFESTRLIRGLEKTRLLEHDQRSIAPSIILALTGLGSRQDQEHARDVGMDFYLTKPLRLQQLRDVLEGWDPGNRPSTLAHIANAI